VSGLLMFSEQTSERGESRRFPLFLALTLGLARWLSPTRSVVGSPSPGGRRVRVDGIEPGEQEGGKRHKSSAAHKRVEGSASGPRCRCSNAAISLSALV
jgi:hypothetical protein